MGPAEMIVKILIITLTVLLLITGLIGSIVPGIPGPVLVLAGALVYAVYTDFAAVSWRLLLFFAGLTLLSQLLDYTASVIGAKKFGASRWGIAGSFAGALAGVVIAGIPGLIIGPFVGAVLCELVRGSTLHASMRTGFGTFVGFLGGALGKLIIALIMIGLFLIQAF